MKVDEAFNPVEVRLLGAARRLPTSHDGGRHMAIPKWWLGCLLTVVWIGSAGAQTIWPEFMPNLRADLSLSPVAVEMLPATVKQPAPDVPPEKARWSGRWAGWACRDRACDTKLIVETVTSESATIIYDFASAWVKPDSFRTEARFVDDELQATFPNGAKVAYRMRKGGDVEFLYRNGPADWVAGILSKEK